MASQLDSLAYLNEGSTKRKEILGKFLDLELFDKKFKNVTYYSSDRFLKPSVAYKDSFFTYSDGWRSDVHSRLFCDVNGDGKDDLVGIGRNDIDVSLYTKSRPLAITFK